jgi:hypothetical protein
MTAEPSTDSVTTKPLSLVRIALLSLLFVGAYFVLRALPDAQCGFLHYEEVVNADGSVEFCATNHAGFLDLTRLKYPVDMELVVPDAAQPGQVQQVTLELLTSGGMPIAPHELAVTHTKKMHVMLIDPSLSDYHHVHPQPVGLNGQYTFQFTPNRAGRYQVFAEVVPLRTRRQIIATGTIAVGENRAADMTFERRTESVVDGLRFDLGEVPERLRTGVDYHFDLQVTAADGSAIELQQVMGAKGHMVAFDAAGKGFAHMHPFDSVVAERSSAEQQDLSFLFNVPNPGWYRVFAQVQVNAREVFGHFDLQVE